MDSLRPITVLAVLGVLLAPNLGAAGEAQVIVIRKLDESLSGIKAANADVKLSVHSSAELGQPVLSVTYLARTGPASRDVWSDAEITDWTARRAIAFKVNPDQSIRLSVSFRDANGVAYTAWADLKAGAWQDVELPFAEIKPNPYFQPPGAKTDAPLDVSAVARIGFAPQSQAGGHLSISEFTLVE